MKSFLIPLLMVLLASCALLGPRFYRTQFEYEQNGNVSSFPILVPPGFLKKESSADSLGNQGVLYQYANARFFIFYAKDTGSIALAQLDPSENQPKRFRSGGLVYKGMDDGGNYWRVIRHPHLRIGYTGVPRSQEIIFDSAVNYTADHIR